MSGLAHIINPVQMAPTSDLGVAQAITFETMRTARKRASSVVDVELYAAAFREDRSAVPPDFLRTTDIERSLLDAGTFRRPRKLPLLKDVLHRLYEATDAEYLIYTNADIGLQPDFYVSVQRLIEAGHDALVINRRNIPRRYSQPSEIPQMYAAAGRPHPGWDCFVFPRAVFPHYDLGEIAIGIPRVGLALLANLMVHAVEFREVKRLHLTFHRGDDRRWIARSSADFAAHNTREVIALLRRLEAKHGPFSRQTPPGRFLFRKRLLGPLYETWVRGAAVLARRFSS